MMQVGNRRRTLRGYAAASDRLREEVSKTYPHPATVVALSRAVVVWAGETEHTWEAVVESDVLPTIAFAARQMMCWSVETLEEPGCLRDVLLDLCGGGPEHLTGTFRTLIEVANDRAVEQALLDQYEDVLDPLDPVDVSSDSSNPRDHGALYQNDSDLEGSSNDSFDSSNDPDPHARYVAQGWFDDDVRVAPDHQRYVAAGEYATLIEFLGERPGGPRLLEEFRDLLGSRHAGGEHPFPPLSETTIVHRFHPRYSLGNARQQAGNVADL